MFDFEESVETFVEFARFSTHTCLSFDSEILRLSPSRTSTSAWSLDHGTSFTDDTIVKASSS